MKDEKKVKFTTGTIIIIVIALIVLVILALGFGIGWNNLWSSITGGDSANVASIRQECSVACSAGSAYDFCTLQRDVIRENADGSLNRDWTVEEGGAKTCKDLVGLLGFDSCPAVNCGGTDGTIGAGECKGSVTKTCADFANVTDMQFCDGIGCHFTSTGGVTTCTGTIDRTCESYKTNQVICLKLGCEWV